MVKRFLFLFLFLVLVAGCTEKMVEKRAQVIKLPEVAPGAEYLGTEACLECHEDLAADAKTNVHLRLAAYEAPGYQTGCEGCHGPGSIHVDEGGDTEKILRFGEEGLEGEEASAVCLTCHQGGETMHWLGSEHAENDVACTDCHKVHHNSKPQLLAQDEFELCSKCHRDVQAKMYFISRHPVKEGKMSCTDCHNPHGTGNPIAGMLRTEERLNDLCLTCHTRYQGPFVFEHDPVIEDCTICHDPHGTVANNLLKQNEPFLCLQCHEAHFHATRDNARPGTVFPDDVAVSDPVGTGTSPVLFKDPYTGQPPRIVSQAHGWQKAFLTKCTQCHQNVHGSDLPSQSLPSRGFGLTR